MTPWRKFLHRKINVRTNRKSKKIITEVEENGGMTKLIELGIPKNKIEQAAIKRQAQIDSKSILIIGLNALK